MFYRGALLIMKSTAVFDVKRRETGLQLMRVPGWKKAALLLTISLCTLLFIFCDRDSGAELPWESNEEHGALAPEWSRYDPPAEITFVRESGINVDALEAQHPNETLADNRWTRLYEEVLGIRIRYDWVEKGDSYRQKLGIALASGDIPDVVKVNAEQLRLLSNAGYIQDLTAVYDEYASALTKDILTQEGARSLDAAMIDGRMMGIPQTDSSIEKAMVIWIRMDWLENIGLDAPRTMNDVLAISKAFAELDPDQNGEDDTYGLAVTSYLWDPVAGLTGFMAGYGAYPQLWLRDSSGELVYGGIQPEVRSALKALQEMYRQGQIDREFALKNGAQVKKSLSEGKIGLMYGEQWGAFHVEESRTGQHVKWQAYPIVSVSGEPPKVPLKFNTAEFFAVRKGYEHPEAVVKLFNLHLEKNWGGTAEYDTYYNDSGPVWQFSPVTPYPAKKNLEAYRQIAAYERTGDPSVLDNEARSIANKIDLYRERGDSSGWGWERIYGPDGAFAVIDAYELGDQLLYDQFTGGPTETMIDRASFLHDLQNEIYINIIMGRPLEDFDRFVEQWRVLGGDQITEEVNAWYRKQTTVRR